ncbi:viral A-type inclusion protein [Leptotrichia sp. HSP-342]|uniref:Viral A-type inclusion protein n=1 Tax=Leptotrichia mesophila TaxID=3239303 RepID=A0AB39VDB8_9FUSO
MNKVKKVALLFTLVMGISVFSYSYEDYYQKVYTIKISKDDIFRVTNATNSQQKKLSKIFDEYQKKAESIEKTLVQFDGKKEKLGKIEQERYRAIAKVLTNEQFEAYNSYINSQKSSFIEKNDKVKNFIDSMNLSNEQKSRILKYERDFKREVEKLKEQRLAKDTFISKYRELKQERNEKMRTVLLDDQVKMIENF